MGLSYSRHGDSGLVLAEFGQDEAAISKALRQHDPDLRLVPRHSEKFGKRYYAVYRYAGSDRPAEFVCAWTTDAGEPLPLSSRLLDLVQKLDRNTRGEYEDENARERKRREQLERQLAADTQDLIDDWKARDGRSALLPRGVSLRMARDKRRARGERV